MKRFLQTALIIVTAVAVFLPAYAMTEAATRTQLDVEATGDFVIGPGKTDLSIAPGESEIRQLTVTNRTANETTFNVSVEDFTAASGTEEVVRLLGDQRGPASLQDFVTPELDEFTLASGEQISFSVEVAIPADASPGGRYGAVIVSNAPSAESSGGTQARVVSRLASLMLTRVEGDVTESGQLTDFRISGPDSVFWQSKGPDSFELLFENTGNVHLAPYGQITVSNLLGQTVGTLPVDAYFALPDSTRYRLIQRSTDSFMFGRYTATLNLNRSYGDRVDTAQLSFWVIPWRILGLGLVALLLLAGIVRWFKNRFELRRK
jgi:hypothetical protein